MPIQQILLGAGGAKPYGDVITLDGTTYDLSTIADASSPFKNVAGHYSLVVPADGAKFKLMLWGAGGGDGISSSPSMGGAGGYAYGEFELDAGTYTILVGGGGGYNAHGVRFPDGGPGPDWGGQGGGSTRFGPNVANNASDYNDTDFTYYLIAGGGGGGTNWGSYNHSGTNKGEGGGTVGGDGGMHYAAGEPAASLGGGGTQSAGGSGGTSGRMSNGVAGAKYSGGGSGSTSGGGGGGGYYGGGSGAGYYAQGGGGSGYINTSVVNNGVLQASGTFIAGGSYEYYEAYHGPNNEVPGSSGDHAQDGAARFLYLS